MKLIKRIELDDGSEIRVVRATTRADASAVAIHLLEPDMDELEDAIVTAIRDGFPRIVVHTRFTWPHKRSA